MYLLTKNLRTTQPSKKLDHVKVGPFLILERKGPVNYKLQLPANARIHPVFHVSLLEPADAETPVQEHFQYETEEEVEFEVEALVGYREIGRDEFRDNHFAQEWLVKWKGYPESENTWEPERNLRNCQQLLKESRKRNHLHYYTGVIKENIPEERRHIVHDQTLRDQRTTRALPRSCRESPR